MIRSIRSAAPALAALFVLALAACSDANTTAPNALDDLQPKEERATPPGFTPMVNVTMAVRDYTTGTMVGGTTVAFASGIGGTPKNVVDNSAQDYDKRAGYFKIEIAKNTIYSGTVIASLSKYDRINAMLQGSSNALNVNLGTLNLRTNPLFTIYVRRASDMAYLGGATYTVGWADGSAPWMQRTDNVDDMDPFVGRVKFYGKSNRNHQICEITAPPGYLLPVPVCKTVAGVWDGNSGFNMLH